MTYRRVLFVILFAAFLVVVSGCCGSTSEDSNSSTVTPAAGQPTTPGAPAAPAEGAALPSGPPRTLVLGSWQGEAHGETEQQIAILSIALQETEPTPQQLVRFTPQQRIEIANSRAEMQGEGAEAQLARALVGAMTEVMAHVQVNATATHLAISHGIGDAEDQPRTYSVTSEQNNVLVTQVMPPAGEGGLPETVTFTFNPDGSVIMQITNEDGESTSFRLTRGQAASASPTAVPTPPPAL